MALPGSDDELLLLHNPRCSKSRAALALLEGRGLPVTVRRYLEEPLSRAELADLRQRLGRAPSEWIRRGESAFVEAGLDEGASESDLLELMARSPSVIERPILIRGERAAVGRPPEKLLELL